MDVDATLAENATDASASATNTNSAESNINNNSNNNNNNNANTMQKSDEETVQADNRVMQNTRVTLILNINC